MQSASHRFPLLISLLISALCCNFSAKVAAQPGIESQRYYAVASKRYTIEDGLLDNCIEAAFTDSVGRLKIIPCGFVQAGQRLHMYHFDGQRSYAYDVAEIPDTGQWSIVSSGVTVNRELFGYLLEDADNESPSSSFFVYNIDADTWKIIDVPVVDGERVNLRNAVHFNGEFIVLAQTPQKAHIFKINSSDQFEHVASAAIDGAGGALRRSLAFTVTNEAYWLEAWQGMIYRINKEDNSTLSISTENLMRGLTNVENRFVQMPTGELLYVIQGKSLAFLIDIDEVTCKPYIPTFASGKLRSNTFTSFQDDIGNVLIIGHTQGSVPKYEAWLMDKQGTVHDYSDVLRSFSQDTDRNMRSLLMVSKDFRRKLSAIGQTFVQVDVTSRPGVRAFASRPMRGVIELPNGNLAISRSEVFDGDSIVDNTGAYSNCLMLREQDCDIVSLGQGVFWYGAFKRRGLTRFDTRNNTCENYLTDYVVRRLAPGPPGKLIVLASQELVMFDIATGNTVPLLDEPLMAFLNVIHYTQAGNILIGTSEGLFSVNLSSRSLEKVSLGTENAREQVLCIYENRQGVLWLGTRSHGILILDPIDGELRTINEDQGLSNNIVASLVEDDNGNVWAGTYDGISIFSSEARLIGYLYEEGGLVNNECNRWSAHRLLNGKLFFGSPKGFSIIDPSVVISSTKDLEVIKIFPTRITVDRNTLTEGEPGFSDGVDQLIQIPAADRSISVSYGLSNYTAPEARSYAYRYDLPGQSWNYVGSLSDLTLTNLSPGKYDVLIKGTDYKGSESANVLSISLQVHEFFYKTWWFYMLLTLPLIGFAILWARRQKLEQRRLESEVERRTQTIRSQADALRELDKTKSRLYTNITHEFRTPLTVILGLSDKVSEDDQAPELIKRNTLQLLDLVNQMLDLRKLESGNLKLDLEQADIIRFLSYIGESIRSLAEIHHQQFHFLAPTDPLVMDFDREKLTRVVTNLLSNSIKFTPEGGDIYLQVEEVKPGEDQVVIKVTDTGVGIPADKIDHIFERFYQVDDSTTRRGEGTGIGLTLVKELIDLMGGDISVQSKPGYRTTFSVTLPVENEAPLGISSVDYPEVIVAGIAQGGTYAQAAEVESNGDHPLVLIVEDNPDVLHYIGSCIQEDYHIAIALNGEEGIEKAFELVPDIVISDVMMPVKNGYELCQTLKEDVRTSHIPIILLTAKADADSRLSGLERGADAYLSKPFDERELSVRMRHMLELRDRLRMRYSNGVVTPTDDDPTLVQEDAFIARFRQALLDNLSDMDFGVSEISGALHLSRTQVHKKMTALTGKSASLYMRSIRLKEATAMLRDNAELTISEIAYKVGFKDPKYFARVFKEEFGTTPSAFREEMNINPPDET